MVKTERSFYDLAEMLPQMVFSIAPDGKVLFVNQRYLTYTGLADAADVHQHWADTVHSDEIASIREAWQHTLSTGEPFRREHRIRGADGEYRWFMSNAVALKDESGEIDEWVVSVIDIHDQRMGEEAIRKNEKLATAGRLAASVAHEINNPLASVTNLLYLLGSNPSLDRAAREYVQSAQNELARVSEITTQMLRFHRQATAAAPTRISETLDSILALYRGRIMSAGIQLIREYDITEPLTCLAGEIRQAFANVIGNALDATPRGGRIHVRLRHSRNWKTRRKLGIRVTIADTGRGIEPRNFQRIFEAFYTTKGVTGTGLGLWITKDLIEKHSGTLTLRSSTRLGSSGTVFSIFLPFEAPPPDPA